MINEQFFRQNYPQAISPTNLPTENDGTISKVPEFFIENDFYMNIGHEGEFHMSFPDSEKERDVTFQGTIVGVGRDHIVLYNSTSNTWYMLPLLYLNYAATKEKPHLLSENV